MLELIVLIILFSSLFGILMILFRKIPILVELPQEIEIKKIEKESAFPFNFKKISFDFEKTLQKILSKFRILTLKIENKISYWLENLRQRSKNKNNQFPDGYWEKLKK